MVIGLIMYKTKKNIVLKQFKIILFAFIIISLLPISVFGQNYWGPSFKESINKIDEKIHNLIFQRKRNHENQDKINIFVAEAGKWFTASSNIQNKINQARGRSGAYSNLNSQRLQQELQKLEQEKNAINGLNGGATIQGVTFYSIGELKSAMTKKSNEIIELINYEEQIKIDLQSLDIERDKYTAEIELDDELDQQKILEEKLDYLEEKKSLNQEDFMRRHEQLKDVNYWCQKINKDSPIKCLHRRLYISKLTAHYANQLVTTPGKKYNQNEFAQMIKNARDQSNTAKQEEKDRMDKKLIKLASIQQQIDVTRKELNKKKIIEIDPSGCWVIPIGTKRPQINIIKNSYGEYDGIITDPGSSAYKKGKRLFTMARINSTTFEGTEYSHSKSGIQTRIPLRVIVKKGIRNADYRTSDDQLTLLPCW